MNVNVADVSKHLLSSPSGPQPRPRSDPVRLSVDWSPSSTIIDARQWGAGTQSEHTSRRPSGGLGVAHSLDPAGVPSLAREDTLILEDLCDAKAPTEKTGMF